MIPHCPDLVDDEGRTYVQLTPFGKVTPVYDEHGNPVVNPRPREWNYFSDRGLRPAS